MSTELTFYNKHFEQSVRNALDIYDRPITDEDAPKVFELDCTNFYFDSEDYPVLTKFKKLKKLFINTRADELGFLRELPLIDELSLETWSDENVVDFNSFSHLTDLEDLFVSGGDISNIDFINLDGICDLPKLNRLSLHEFGTVDLGFLRKMPQLENFMCGWANSVKDIDAIGAHSGLKSLYLVALYLDDLDFLDNLADDIEIELSSLSVKKGIDYGKLARFKNGDFDDIDEN